MKRLRVRIRPSLLVTIIYKYTKISTIYKLIYITLKYIYKHQSYKKHSKVIANANLIKAWIELNLFIVLDLIK